MTLLSIAQRVADEVGLPRPSAVAAGSDQLARQMFALANRTVEDLAKLNWPVLERAGTFATVNGTSQYALPSGYNRMIGNSVYNSSSYYKVRGQLAPAEWQRQRYSMLSGIGRFKVKVYGYPAMINVTPTPTTAETLVYEYVSNDRVVTDGESPTYSSLYVNDTDTCLIPEELVSLGLKWRVKHAKGLDYAEDFNEYVAASRQVFAQTLDLEDLPVAVRNFTDTPEISDGYVPENGFG